ncbi:hypothetical protein [Companilactobacillus musae]|uniref:hypothetical protein n=1 Tax=Companilactobacillus musae TaxID=1903258 RepID=UPI0013C2F39B|nr:hypothetical protein [Companilactobacillus musae]
MNIFKFNKNILVAAVLIFLLGAILMFISFSALGFNVQNILSHLGSWYTTEF